MTQKYKQQITMGVDARDGKVAVKGWKEVTALDSFEFCKELVTLGAGTIIYTDISKDGAMQGSNVKEYKRLSEIQGVNIIASGGISSERELEVLKDIVDGAILGKALYDGVLDLKKCIEIAGEQ